MIDLKYIRIAIPESRDHTGYADGVLEIVLDGGRRLATTAEIELATTIEARAAIVPITRAQAKAALIVSGLIAQVQPAIDAIADPMQRALAQNDWDERLHFERSNPTLAAMAAALGMTDAQLDDLFALAASL